MCNNNRFSLIGYAEERQPGGARRRSWWLQWRETKQKQVVWSPGRGSYGEDKARTIGTPEGNQWKRWGVGFSSFCFCRGPWDPESLCLLQGVELVLQYQQWQSFILDVNAWCTSPVPPWGAASWSLSRWVGLGKMFTSRRTQVYLEPNIDLMVSNYLWEGSAGLLFECHSHIYFSVFPNWTRGNTLSPSGWFRCFFLLSNVTFYFRLESLIYVIQSSHHPIIPLRKAKKHKKT